MEGVVVDTSIWLQYFRVGSSHEALTLRTMLESDRVILVGVVYSELLRGTRNADQMETLIESLSSLPYVETDKETWQLSGEILSSLERTGQRVPLPDALIAAIAIQNDLPLYTLDAHFNRIPDLRLHEQPSGQQ